MCFIFKQSADDNYPPPRRAQYGHDYGRYLRDYDQYQRDHEKHLTYKKRRHRAGTKNAALGAAGMAGGTGC
ncbi:hypothetical protein N7492_006836 [Penicillium capsulatum]|uniref:Uncharacterized protein n=1 Tax=Penicillium capsulatum TaxID=69766 RepID=A0A9W9HYN8_9EURO|nr:hypothetical protein N7492_006836 [Penicillium capsulatum]